MKKDKTCIHTTAALATNEKMKWSGRTVKREGTERDDDYSKQLLFHAMHTDLLIDPSIYLLAYQMVWLIESRA